MKSRPCTLPSKRICSRSPLFRPSKNFFPHPKNKSHSCHLSEFLCAPSGRLPEFFTKTDRNAACPCNPLKCTYHFKGERCETQIHSPTSRTRIAFDSRATRAGTAIRVNRSEAR